MIRLASMGSGSAHSRAHRLGQRDGAGVEGTADNDALDAGVGHGSERGNVGHAADAAGGQNSIPRLLRQRHGVVDVGPITRAVSADVGVEKRSETVRYTLRAQPE